jgi:hypothetical protein
MADTKQGTGGILGYIASIFCRKVVNSLSFFCFQDNLRPPSAFASGQHLSNWRRVEGEEDDAEQLEDAIAEATMNNGQQHEKKWGGDGQQDCQMQSFLTPS